MTFTYLALPIVTIVCAAATIALIVTGGTAVSSGMLTSLSTLTCVLSVITAQNTLRQVRN